MNAIFYFLLAFDDDSLPDGAWWAKLEDGVKFWNEDEDNDFDPHETVSNYIEWRKKNDITADSNRLRLR